MIRLHALFLLLAAAFSLSGEFRHYRTAQKAGTLYMRGEYFKAEQLYRSLTASDHGKDGVSAIRFNLAGSLAMQGKHTEARELYRSITMNPQGTELRNPALYNEGTSLALEGITAKKTGTRRKLLEQALLRYIAILRTDPAETDARINYEIVFGMLRKENTSSAQHQENSLNKGVPLGGEQMKAAKRILENAQLQENSLMRKIPQNHETGSVSGKNSRDW